MKKRSPVAVMEEFLNRKMTQTEKVDYEAAVRKETRQKESESQITQACVRWFREEFPEFAKVLIHPANEGARRTKVVSNAYGTRVVSTGGARLKAEGLVAGVADLLLLVPRQGCGCLAIEMKTHAKRSGQSERQKEWQAAVTKAGNRYVVCRSRSEFEKAIREYLENS